MINHQDSQSTRHLTEAVRFVGSSQKLARLRHTGFVAGSRRYSGCVLRADDPSGRVRFIGCVRVTDETGDITARDLSIQRFITTVIPSRKGGDWEAALTRAALAADGLAERAAIAAGGAH